MTAAATMDALTLVIASQRSGSTLLCRDIESLGGMGAPKEHFLDILPGRKTAETQATTADVLTSIAKGIKPDAPTVGAVKLMVNYAPKIDAILQGTQETGAPKALNNILDWATERFVRVNLVVLVRKDPLDQAISRAVAGLTDIWHRNAAALPEGSDPYSDRKLAPKAVNMAILDNLPGVLRQNEILRDFARQNADRCLLVEYETLAADVAGTSARLVDHARKAGFAPARNMAERNLRKLIDAERAETIRSDFRRFMKKRIGI